MKKVVVLDDYQGCVASLAPWEALAPEATMTALTEHVSEVGELARRLQGAQVVVMNRERTPLTAELLAAAPGIELIVTLGLRNDSLDLAAAAAHGITVCGTTMLAHPTSELTWGLILALMRHLPEEAASLRAGRWQSDRLGTGLSGLRLGIVGLGRLGKEVARVGVAFGMEVVAWSRSLTAETAADVGAQAVGAEFLWRESDVVSLHVPLTPQTMGLVSARELGMMKRSARLVNTSRAAVVDQHALVAALESGNLAGAAIDVYDNEPLPANDPLLKAPNLLLTPHLGYVTEENYRSAYGQVVEDIRAWLDGSPVRVIQPRDPA